MIWVVIARRGGGWIARARARVVDGDSAGNSGNWRARGRGG